MKGDDDMDHNKEKKPSFLSAMILIILAFVLIVTVFFLSGKNSNANILLPTERPGQIQTPDDAVSVQDNFLKVTTENVQSVVRTMSRPASYHQICQVTLTEGPRTTSQIVDVWVDGSRLRADVSSETGTATLLTDGTTAYLWHSEEEGYSSVVLNDTVSADDLLGLPTYEQLLNVDSKSLTEAAYVVLPEQGKQCIFVSASADNGTKNEYWIDISSGLLFMATSTVNDEVLYSVQQSDLEHLAAGDEAFSDRFQLPDGYDPFSGK